jgi:membrane associated rhomboid family serine protease
MSGNGSPVFTYSVITFCSVVFLGTLFLPFDLVTQLYYNYALDPATFLYGSNYLTLFTYQFLHLNFQHLISNMFVLFFVGRAIENEVGSTKFGITYLSAGVGAGLLHVLFNQHEDVMVIGASGAIFGVISLLLLLRPFKFTSAMIIPVPGVVLGISLLVVDVASIMFSSDVWVAHDIHLYGFLVGGLVSFGIDYDRALKGLIISVLILLCLYYWAFYVEGIVL